MTAKKTAKTALADADVSADNTKKSAAAKKATDKAAASSTKTADAEPKKRGRKPKETTAVAAKDTKKSKFEDEDMVGVEADLEGDLDAVEAYFEVKTSPRPSPFA